MVVFVFCFFGKVEEFTLVGVFPFFFYCFLVQVMIGGAFRTHYKIGLSWFDPIFVKFQLIEVANLGVRMPINHHSSIAQITIFLVQLRR